MAEIRPLRRGAEELGEFSVRVLQRLGALVEPAGDRPIEARLPEELAGRLGGDELLVVSAEPAAGAERLAFGAPLVDRIFELADEKLVPLAEVEIADGMHAPLSAAEQMARERLTLQNASLRG